MDSRLSIFLIALIIFLFVATDIAISLLGSSMSFLKETGVLAKDVFDPSILI